MIGFTMGSPEDSVIRRANLIVSLRLSTGLTLAAEFRRAPCGRGEFSFSDDIDETLRVDPKTESVDNLGEGNTGTGESGARIASTEAVVNRDDVMVGAGLGW